MIESIPLSKYCPLQWVEADEETKIALRNRAVEVEYSELDIEPNEISRVLMEEFDVDQTTADAATECLGKIYRNNCQTCMIGQTGCVMGIVPRE